ncbi:hypothetical protein FA95DRAFT_1560915 [Auriscalpium vulgare]|uniref:Uncharacterized protein n=1 Tax=Auriscalpium vulgare TaxID=40419 RepID=A0ACB8RP55_9AGAM|nr:hypothetical protein FA95DRAFT_1560915 [Auriscalpium vulgare]
MPPTAWSKQGSALTSDRLRPQANTSRSTSPASSSGKGKGKAKEVEAPKSAEVRRLEGLLRDLTKPSPTTKPAPSETCFCNARNHPLSPYTPLCTNCGLILCALHPAHLPCPHCAAPLLPQHTRAALIVRIDEELRDTLAREEAARIKAAEDARRAVGAFPALPGAAGAKERENEPHKVLSLNPKTKRVMVSSFVPAAKAKAAGNADAEKEEEAVVRVPPPPEEVSYVKAGRSGRPWLDLRGDVAMYVPEEKPKERSEKGKGKKSAGGQHRRVVPGAAVD